MLRKQSKNLQRQSDLLELLLQGLPLLLVGHLQI